MPNFIGRFIHTSVSIIFRSRSVVAGGFPLLSLSETTQSARRLLFGWLADEKPALGNITYSTICTGCPVHSNISDTTVII